MQMIFDMYDPDQAGYNKIDETSSEETDDPHLPGGALLKEQRTHQQYRLIDLTLFAVMLAAFESLVVTAGIRWFPGEAYLVSVTAVITAIVMMRWGAWAALHAVLGGAVTCLAAGMAEGRFLAVYCVGNLGALLALALREKMGPESIRQSVWRTLLFGAAVLLGMQAGRAAVCLVLTGRADALTMFFAPEAVTMLFTLVVLWIARRIDGLFEDQGHYLKRMRQQFAREEAEEEGGSQ